MTEVEIQRESLSDEINHLEREARMMLPGIQGLFGFQLACVFTESFSHLSAFQQYVHLAAMTLNVFSIMLTMAPASFHRRAEPAVLSRRFAHYSNRWLRWAVIPLSLALTLDFYLITYIICRSQEFAVGLALVIFSFLFFTWYVFPEMKKLSDVPSSRSK